MRLEGQIAIITGVSHEGQVGFALASAFLVTPVSDGITGAILPVQGKGI
jgi:hypothetical protein